MRPTYIIMFLIIITFKSFNV